MVDLFKDIVKQPYWVITLIVGVALVLLTTISVDKGFRWEAHGPSSRFLVIIGLILLCVSVAGFGLNLWSQLSASRAVGRGLDLSQVKESTGVHSTTVSGCEIRVINGRIEDYKTDSGTVVVLPCNEYFDDECAADAKSALGAYVNRVFIGQVDQFISLLLKECRAQLGPGREEQKTNAVRATSFGAGKSLLLSKPLGRPVHIAVVSSTTQRAGEGLSARISYLFDGMQDLVARLADARLNDVVMPVLGAGHGRIDTPMAFVGLLLAVAEAARYGQGGQRLRRVTIVVFKHDSDTPAQVDEFVVRRALALIAN
jgi:hypothetical protein